MIKNQLVNQIAIVVFEIVIHDCVEVHILKPVDIEAAVPFGSLMKSISYCRVDGPKLMNNYLACRKMLGKILSAQKLQLCYVYLEEQVEYRVLVAKDLQLVEYLAFQDPLHPIKCFLKLRFVVQSQLTMMY